MGDEIMNVTPMAAHSALRMIGTLCLLGGVMAYNPTTVCAASQPKDLSYYVDPDEAQEQLDLDDSEEVFDSEVDEDDFDYEDVENTDYFENEDDEY